VKFLPWFGLLRCRCCSHKSRYVLFVGVAASAAYTTILSYYGTLFTRFVYSVSSTFTKVTRMCFYLALIPLARLYNRSRFVLHKLHTSVVLLLTGVSIHTSIFYLRRIAHTVLRRDSRHQHFFSFLRIGFVSYPSNSPPLGVRAAPIPCLRTSSSDMPRSLYVLN